jgi:hypothetical protein
MSNPASEVRTSRRDVMELLARARPASLDRGPAGAAHAREAAARIVVSGDPAAAPAGQVPGRTPAPHPGPAARRPRRRRAAALAGAGLAAAATAVAVVLATGGGPAGGPAPARSTVLTAAMVRRVARASALAMATSGRAITRYSTSQDGALQVSGTDDMTFAGKNWNDSLSQSFPASDGSAASSQHAVNRVVNEHFYLFTIGPTGRWEWIRDTNPSGHPSVTAPDPRKLLRVLQPSARFVSIGYQVVDGVRLRGLRATDPGAVPPLDSLFSTSPAGRATSLTVWVDGHDVVRLMNATLRSATTEWRGAVAKVGPHVKGDSHGHPTILVPNRAMLKKYRAALAKKNPQHIVVRIDHHLRAGTPHRVVQLSTVSVTFSGIGQPQHITAPRHSVGVYGRG